MGSCLQLLLAKLQSGLVTDDVPSATAVAGAHSRLSPDSCRCNFLKTPSRACEVTHLVMFGRTATELVVSQWKEHSKRFLPQQIWGFYPVTVPVCASSLPQIHTQWLAQNEDIIHMHWLWRLPGNHHMRLSLQWLRKPLANDVIDETHIRRSQSSPQG